MSSKFEDILLKYKSNILDEKIFFSPSIPVRKLENAVKSFAENENASNIVALIDNTTFGSAKDGLLLSTKAVYFHNMMEAPKSIELINIKNVTFKEGVIESSLGINDTFSLKINFPSKKSMFLFAEMLNEIVEQITKIKSNDNKKLTDVDIINELRLLKKLSDEGLITGDEYEKKRNKILQRI
jgi:hypothetical protein